MAKKKERERERSMHNFSILPLNPSYIGRACIPKSPLHLTNIKIHTNIYYNTFIFFMCAAGRLFIKHETAKNRCSF